MEAVTAALTELSGDALPVIAASTALILGIPVAFKAIAIGKRVISKF